MRLVEPTRFVIAGTQRTGTTLLRTSLSSHPDIDCRGEVFNLGKSPYVLPGGYWAFARQDASHRLSAAVFPRRSFRNFLDHLYRERACGAVGFKVMLNHCMSRPYLWPLIAEYGVKVILVTRRNVLKTLVSRCAAAVSGVYHVSASLPAKTAVADWKPRTVKINSATVIQELDKIAQEADGWR